MSHWQKIRDAANALRIEICAAQGLDENVLHNAHEFLDLTADHLGLDLIPEHPDSTNLSKADAALEDDCVYFNNHLSEWRKHFCIAHEIGHFRLHQQGIHCETEAIDETAVDGDGASAAEKIVGYGAGERREREANLFALELLLPAFPLKISFLSGNTSAREIAEAIGVPAEMVAGQLARAVLVPMEVSRPESGERAAAVFELDPSQRRAAEEANCPTLVAAGPGTGKTQTLTSRIAHLISSGIQPKRILALTFSNKAAEEMRERIARFDAAAAAQIQVMTFHAFGLDLLRSFYVEAGLDVNSQLFDKIDALFFLEQNLTKLALDHFQVLHDPTANLPALLGAVSRAKDELCTPEDYRALGEKMLAGAREAEDEDLIVEAEKTLETARVYAIYEEYLSAEKLLDFGDLIFRAVRLLQNDPAVKREVRGKYDAILVDEFQDVNRACGLLLKEIAGDGETLWAVGDLRQSIYRWRGASPANISLFADDFPNAERVSLETNYRSNEAIVSVFSEFARSMKAAGANFFHEWIPARGAAAGAKLPPVHLEVGDSLEAEANRIAENIEKYRAAGFAYKDCAVICRTHSQLGKFAKVLSARRIPVFYLGEFLEREEVRDLLSLLDLLVSPGARSLVRVARFPEYSISQNDALKLAAAIGENGNSISQTLGDAEIVSTISAEGRAGAEKLVRHISAFKKGGSAWSFLANYLFTDSEFLKRFFKSSDVDVQSQRLALYQFLRLAQSAESRFSDVSDPVAAFLNYVKRLAVFNEDRNYAQIPSEAEHLDAVRLLTIHSAKGLEFPVVFLPYLGAGKFPGSRRGQICPNPAGMIEGEADFHDEEEECLFFVACSRARDHLHLSRAERYGATNSKESKFLTVLSDILPDAAAVSAPQSEDSGNAVITTDETRRTFYFSELDRYLRCPRRYYYSDHLGLKDAGPESIYQKFHNCVYQTFSEIPRLKDLASLEAMTAAALARLDEHWLAAEVDSHAYAPIYRAKAEELVRRMCSTADGFEPDIVNDSLPVNLSNGIVRVPLDAVEFTADSGEETAVIRKYKTGKQPKKPAIDDSDVLRKRAAEQNFPQRKPVLKKFYLGDDTAAETEISERVMTNRLEKYERAIDGIKSGSFEPAPSAACPHCPHYFICPSGE